MTRHARALLAGTLVLTGCAEVSPSPRSSPENHLSAQVAQAVASLMEKHRVPGVAVAYIEQGRLRAAQGFGFTDHTRTNQIEAGATVFEAASLGKPLFSYAVVQSAQSKQIDLDAPIADYLGSRVVADPNGHSMTAAHLLSHSSGLTFSPTEGRRWLARPPGSQWQYSGLGFVVLQQAIERVFGRSLDEFIRQALTKRLEMHRTTFSWADNPLVVLAIGHDRQGDAVPRTKWRDASAASSLHTTAIDYARFMEQMFIDLSAGSDGSTVGRVMIRPRIEVDRALGLWWGLGWALASENGEVLFLHWGSNPGYKSLVVGSVSRALGLVVLTNGDNGLELATALVPLVLGRQYSFLRFKMLHPDD